MLSALKKYLVSEILDPISQILKQGITPHKVSMSLSFGFIFGISPIVGSSTLLCAIAAFMFRLNMVVIQLVNYAAYPLQVLLILPYITLGGFITGVKPFDYTIEQIMQKVADDYWQAAVELWELAALALVGWLATVVPIYFLIYISSRWIIRRFEPKP